MNYPTLSEAMEVIKAEREGEIGTHTWKQLVDHYGEAILFAEIASIVSRLEGIFWHENPYKHPDDLKILDRAIDLCIDLGNYTDFLYRTILDRKQRATLKTNFVSGGKLSSEDPSSDEEPR